ncbi:GAF domain nucleotide-binding protein [Ophiocordyceps camponoti-floridani]|uniref:GAF domain nucleotide-binding protein n=1 Tax=Ophiocordyceps camponoti-floridani TaxID=2030778 RepID=A0A8H4VFB3_9HYPO|nr:GAF domain nucleotide-binding protein [Ophiocordyceps camponoti-floridani]
MVHADATDFANDVTKDEAYDHLLLHARALFVGQRNWICNLANTASLLWHAYKAMPHPSNKVNWAGFYVMDRSSTSPRLLLGPFQGKVACQSIDLGRGVCGRAASSSETLVVDDVDEDVNHIACDSASKSEIVVPVIRGQGGRDVVAVIDIDCAAKRGFDDCDKRKLQLLAELLSESCDW